MINRVTHSKIETVVAVAARYIATRILLHIQFNQQHPEGKIKGRTKSIHDRNLHCSNIQSAQWKRSQEADEHSGDEYAEEFLHFTKILRRPPAMMYPWSKGN
jgi:hypothetical protein